MRVLFLDVDGVLNSHAWYARRVAPLERPRDEFDPEAVALLNELLERSGADVCVSSTWRMGRDVPQLRKLFESVGVRCRVIGKTPCRNDGYRGREIKMWLADHPEVECFVVIDDDSDMDPVRDRFVKTSFDHGIQRVHVERAVALLSEPAP